VPRSPLSSSGVDSGWYSATAFFGQPYRPGCVAAVVVTIARNIASLFLCLFLALLIFFRGEEFLVVEVISGVKREALVPGMVVPHTVCRMLVPAAVAILEAAPRNPAEPHTSLFL